MILHFKFYKLAKGVVCAISALVVCAILGKLKSFKNLKRQIILHVFTNNLYPQSKYFYIFFFKLKKIKVACVQLHMIFTGLLGTLYVQF